eukprot:NODE_174_length_14184_cov_0.583671.p8 type:complete len:239 gc:universal NODE_174_length_14184_cov_0.583671:4196-4912(+)
MLWFTSLFAFMGLGQPRPSSSEELIRGLLESPFITTFMQQEEFTNLLANPDTISATKEAMKNSKPSISNALWEATKTKVRSLTTEFDAKPTREQLKHVALVIYGAFKVLLTTAVVAATVATIGGLVFGTTVVVGIAVLAHYLVVKPVWSGFRYFCKKIGIDNGYSRLRKQAKEFREKRKSTGSTESERSPPNLRETNSAVTNTNLGSTQPGEGSSRQIPGTTDRVPSTEGRRSIFLRK